MTDFGTKRARPKRIELKEGIIVIPIYESSDGCFCVETTHGEKRKRITRTSLDAAKVEAQKLIAQIASGRSHKHALTLAETDDSRLAKQKLAPFNVSLLTAVEEWISTRKRTQSLSAKNVTYVVTEFLAEKELEGVGKLHLSDRQSRLRKFAASFPCRIDHITAIEVEVWLKDIRSIFNCADRPSAERRLAELVIAYSVSAPKLSAWLETAIPEGFTVFAFPAAHQRRLRTSNALERVNHELKRRTRVARIFPNEASLLRLVSALLAETSDHWESSKAYLDMHPSIPPST